MFKRGERGRERKRRIGQSKTVQQPSKGRPVRSSAKAAQAAARATGFDDDEDEADGIEDENEGTNRRRQPAKAASKTTGRAKPVASRVVSPELSPLQPVVQPEGMQRRKLLNPKKAMRPNFLVTMSDIPF